MVECRRNFIAFLFDGHVLNLVNLDYDIYTSFTIAASLVRGFDFWCLPTFILQCPDFTGAASRFVDNLDDRQLGQESFWLLLAGHLRNFNDNFWPAHW